MSAGASLPVRVAPARERSDTSSIIPFRRETSAIEKLQAENDALRERLKAFERDFLGDDIVFPVSWRLTPSEKRVMGALLARAQVTRQQLLTAVTLYDGDEPDIKIIDVLICKVRKKLKPLGIHIKTIWGVGYFIVQTTRAELRAKLSTDRHVDVPAVTTPAIDEVLSLPIDEVRLLCTLYRAAGFVIGDMAEDERSFITFRFLPLAVRFGDGWKPQAHADVREQHAAAMAADRGSMRQIAGPQA